MDKTTLRAELPDGTIVSRFTSHEYRYVVAVKCGPEYWNEQGRNQWGVWRWTSRPDLASRAADEARRITEPRYGFTDVRVVPVIQ